MLAQDLVSQGATNSQKSKRINDKAVDSLHASKDIVEKLCFVAQKYAVRQCFILKLVLNLKLIIHQISVSCSYKTVLIKRVYSKVLHGLSVRICMACLIRSTIGAPKEK